MNPFSVTSSVYRISFMQNISPSCFIFSSLHGCAFIYNSTGLKSRKMKLLHEVCVIFLTLNWCLNRTGCGSFFSNLLSISTSILFILCVKLCFLSMEIDEQWILKHFLQWMVSIIGHIQFPEEIIFSISIQFYLYSLLNTRKYSSNKKFLKKSQRSLWRGKTSWRWHQEETLDTK